MASNRMDLIREMRGLDGDALSHLGTYAEDYVNDNGDIEIPDMDPYAESDLERFERFFEDGSDDDDTDSETSTGSSVGDLTDDVTAEGGAEDDVVEISVGEAVSAVPAGIDDSGEAQNAPIDEAVEAISTSEAGLDEDLKCFAT